MLHVQDIMAERHHRSIQIHFDISRKTINNDMSSRVVIMQAVLQCILKSRQKAVEIADSRAF